MKQYNAIVEDILNYHKKLSSNRTDIKTIGTFGTRMEFDMVDGFPLLTTKFVNFRAIVAELLWFLSGSTNNEDLKALGTNIWSPWALETGELGPIYGEQWTNWNNKGINQISELIENLISNPSSRRHIVTGWNPEVVPNEKYTPQENVVMGKAALPACHTMMQFYTRPLTESEMEELGDGEQTHALQCQLYQRSADMFLGVPYNIASYSLLLHMVARATNMVPEKFIWVGGDTHVYENTIEQLEIQLRRKEYPLPKLEFLTDNTNIFNYKVEDIKVKDYKAHPKLTAKPAV